MHSHEVSRITSMISEHCGTYCRKVTLPHSCALTNLLETFGKVHSLPVRPSTWFQTKHRTRKHTDWRQATQTCHSIVDNIWA